MPLFYSGQLDYIAKLNAASDEAFSTTVAATVGGTTTINLSSGGSYFINMGAGNTTLAFTSVPTAYRVLLFIKQNDATPRTITWPGGTLWGTTGAPTLTTGSGKVDIVELRTVNGGTAWYGNLIRLNY
jgi:hypothetical protein